MTIKSGLISENSIPTAFKKEQSWVVLSAIEQRIKEKIEKVGKPLKDWDINIYRGILTGYNEAFIIDGKTKDELIAKSANSAEIIRRLKIVSNCNLFTYIHLPFFIFSML